MLERRPVLRTHVLPVIGLVVRSDQLDLVSSNAKTLAEAAYETGSDVWGLWDKAALVGLMAMINPAEHPFQDYPFTAPRDGTPAAYLWRLMVGGRFIRARAMGPPHCTWRSARPALGAMAA